MTPLPTGRRRAAGRGAARALVCPLTLVSLAAPGSALAAPAASMPAGTITTAAGAGPYGFTGDGGLAIEARLYQPRGVSFDRHGNAYIADALNQRVRRIDSSGVITTIAGNGVEGFGGDRGPALSASLNQPHGVAVDRHGSVFVADSGNNRIRRIDPTTGVIKTLAGDGTPGLGGDGGPAGDARLKAPKTLAIDDHDQLYVADTGNNRVRRIDLTTSTITTVAGVTAAGWAGDGGLATRARLDSPAGIALGPAGALYIADTGNHRVRKVGSDGVITTVAGTGTAGHAGDGAAATSAQLHEPRGIAVSRTGDVYIGEESGQRVRRVDTAGKISTIAGDGVGGYRGDGAAATLARLDRVRGLALDAGGNLWVADTFNNRVRVIFAAGEPPASSAAVIPPWTPPATSRSGYWMLGSDGKVYAFGDARSLGEPAGRLGAAEALRIEPTPTQNGYWVLDTTGRVHAYGDAATLGTVPPGRLASGERAVSLSATPSGAGYWLFTNTGRAFTFGDAASHGDMAGVTLNGPVLSSVATPTGKGYYMVASDGGVFAFGDARFRGSMGGARLNAPVQSLVPSHGSGGYWLVASDGGVFAFGDAPFRESMGGKPLNKPVVGMVRYGAGYLMVAADGGIFNFSDRPFSGSLGDRPPARPINAVATLDR